MDSETTNEITNRIQKLRLAVRKATEEALKDASKEDVVHLKSTNDAVNENDNPNLTSKESFALGMTLFGQGAKAVEKHISDSLEKLEGELKSVVASLGNQPVSETSVVDAKALQKESTHLRARVNFLQLCSKARMALDEASELTLQVTTNDPDYVAAAHRVAAAKVAVDEAEQMVRAEEASASEPNQALFGAYRILDSIRTAIRRKNVDLTFRAKTLLESSVTITKQSIEVRGVRGHGNHDLEGLYAAYDVLEALSPNDTSELDDAIKVLTDNLLDEALLPALQQVGDGQMTSESWSFTEPRKSRCQSLEWIGNRNTSQTKADPIEVACQLFAFLQRVLVFFREHILLGREGLCKYVGERVFGVDSPDGMLSMDLRGLGVDSNILSRRTGLLKTPLLQLLFDYCVPDSLPAQQLVRLEEMGSTMKDCISSFEREMEQAGLYNFNATRPFDDFSVSFETKYVEKRRLMILKEAREILLDNDYHNTMQVGEKVESVKDPSKTFPADDGLSVFKLHKSAVSQTSVKIIGLCRKAMEEAVACDGEAHSENLRLLPPTLYKTARDTLDLFRAIIPTTLAEEIETVPRTAAVLHNDCVFFAHHCLTLGLEFKEKFHPSKDDVRGQTLRQTCMFVDMVPPFRELADRSMGGMLNRESHALFDIVGRNISLLGEALQSNESLSEWVDADMAMSKGLSHVKRVSQVWRPILARDVFVRSVGFLMDSLFGLYLEQVFKANDISAAACHFVSSVFRAGMQGCLETLGDDTGGCRSWDRFSAVGRFMDMTLSDIQVALSDGVFRTLTGPELSKLITSTFDDSEKRARLLRVLSTDSQQ